jgi:hypothetical protein
MKSLKSPRERLLQKFSHERRLLPSEIKGLTRGQSALDELLAEGAVRKLDAFYLSGYEPLVCSPTDAVGLLSLRLCGASPARERMKVARYPPRRTGLG